jgi:hypothetical protein
MLRITTLSGSTYHVCLTSKTWARVAIHPKASYLRTETGTFIEAVYEIGKDLTLICEPHDPRCMFRIIETTPITSIRNIVGPYDVRMPLMLADISTATQPAQQLLALAPQA